MSLFTLQQTKAAIDRLFKELWPIMAGVSERYGDCRTQAAVIQAIVNKGPDHDARIRALVQLSGVKATIASGLLWSFFPDECIPFDKHTMGYCLTNWPVLTNNKITNGTYVRKCATIVAQLQQHAPPLESIEELVVHARDYCRMECPPE
jgi:hypothetical protein